MPPQAGASLQPAVDRIHDREGQRVERDRDEGACHDQLVRLVRKQTEPHARRRQDEAELADLCQAGTDRQAGADRVAQDGDDHDRSQ